MPIPSELIHVDQWVVWRYESRGNGKPTKVPYQVNGQRASSTDATTWTDYVTAQSAADEDEAIAGVGFVVTGNDDFVGIDLDHCYNPNDGTLKAHAAAIVQRCASYTEISPSGEGLRIICRARNIIPAGRSELVEVYPSKRFLTITGNQLGQSPAECRYADDGILHALRLTKQKAETGQRDPDPTVALIQQAGWYLRKIEDGVHEILCPWHTEHTGGDQSGTKWLEANYNGYDRAVFHCHHAHCASRTTGDFLKALGTQPTEEDQAESNPWFWVGNEIFAGAPVLEWVVDGWITAGNVSLLYGKKDTYKSFVAISAGMSVASGVPWHGHSVSTGGFAYLCGEGRSGIAGRMRGWAAHHQIDPTTLPLFLGKRRMRLDNAEEVQEIANSLAEIIETLKWPSLRFLAIDTLSSSTPGLDENDAGAMALAVDVIKTRIAERFGCAVVLVHHAGKDAERGARGSSAIEANAEAVYTITKKDDATHERVELACKHIKDAAKPEPLVLERRVQEIGSTEKNLVFVKIGADEARSQAFWAQSTEIKRQALDMLRGGATVRAVADTLEGAGHDIGKSTVARWRAAFQEFGDLPKDARH